MACAHLWINTDLYEHLNSLPNPCDPWYKITEKMISSESTEVSKISLNLSKTVKNLRDFYVLKVMSINSSSQNEADILQLLSREMLENNAPLLFPFLYKRWVCENKLYLLMQPSDYTTIDNLPTDSTDPKGVEWWTEYLYQLSRAVYFLENHKINHNDINLNNILLQIVKPELAIMLIDYGSAVKDNKIHSGLPPFTLGRDLNYFLYEMIYSGIPNGYFPPELKKMESFIAYQPVKTVETDTFLHGLNMANLTKPNPKTSGKYISRWLAENYNIKGGKCDSARLNKILGAGVGAVIGDSFGMPLEFDYDFEGPVKEMHSSSDFHGLMSEYHLPPGTFTDDTQMALALIDSILINKLVIPEKVAAHFVKWYDGKPKDVGAYTASILSKIKPDGSNWKEISTTIYEKKPQSSANGATMRTWPIPIFCNSLSQDKVIKNALIQANTTHLNPDAAYSAVFVSLLIYKLINNETLDKAIEDSYDVIKDEISYELALAINEAHKLDYKDLDGGSGWIVDTMSVVMWSIKNTTSFKDAIIAAANVKGDTDTNASITGGIVGALYGFNEIPEMWLEALRKNKENLWPLSGNRHLITLDVLKDIIITLAGC